MTDYPDAGDEFAVFNLPVDGDDEYQDAFSGMNFPTNTRAQYGQVNGSVGPANGYNQNGVQLSGNQQFVDNLAATYELQLGAALNIQSAIDDISGGDELHFMELSNSSPSLRASQGNYRQQFQNQAQHIPQQHFPQQIQPQYQNQPNYNQSHRQQFYQQQPQQQIRPQQNFGNQNFNQQMYQQPQQQFFPVNYQNNNNSNAMSGNSTYQQQPHPNYFYEDEMDQSYSSPSGLSPPSSSPLSPSPFPSPFAPSFPHYNQQHQIDRISQNYYTELQYEQMQQNSARNFQGNNSALNFNGNSTRNFQRGPVTQQNNGQLQAQQPFEKEEAEEEGNEEEEEEEKRLSRSNPIPRRRGRSTAGMSTSDRNSKSGKDSDRKPVSATVGRKKHQSKLAVASPSSPPAKVNLSSSDTEQNRRKKSSPDSGDGSRKFSTSDPSLPFPNSPSPTSPSLSPTISPTSPRRSPSPNRQPVQPLLPGMPVDRTNVKINMEMEELVRDDKWYNVKLVVFTPLLPNEQVKLVYRPEDLFNSAPSGDSDPSFSSSDSAVNPAYTDTTIIYIELDVEPPTEYLVTIKDEARSPVSRFSFKDTVIDVNNNENGSVSFNVTTKVKFLKKPRKMFDGFRNRSYTRFTATLVCFDPVTQFWKKSRAEVKFRYQNGWNQQERYSDQLTVDDGEIPRGRPKARRSSNSDSDGSSRSPSSSPNQTTKFKPRRNSKKSGERSPILGKKSADRSPVRKPRGNSPRPISRSEGSSPSPTPFMGNTPIIENPGGMFMETDDPNNSDPGENSLNLSAPANDYLTVPTAITLTTSSNPSLFETTTSILAIADPSSSKLKPAGGNSPSESPNQTSPLAMSLSTITAKLRAKLSISPSAPQPSSPTSSSSSSSSPQSPRTPISINVPTTTVTPAGQFSPNLYQGGNVPVMPIPSFSPPSVSSPNSGSSHSSPTTTPRSRSPSDGGNFQGFHNRNGVPSVLPPQNLSQNSPKTSPIYPPFPQYNNQQYNSNQFPTTTSVQQPQQQQNLQFTQMQISSQNLGNNNSSGNFPRQNGTDFGNGNDIIGTPQGILERSGEGILNDGSGTSGSTSDSITFVRSTPSDEFFDKFFQTH